MKTFVPKLVNNASRKWYIVDASQLVVGKIAVIIANLLRGKNQVDYVSHLDLGDYVIVINSAKINLTGNKIEDKNYYSHSGYLGNLKTRKAKDLLENNPNKIIFEAVSGMIPNNKLKKNMLKRLKIFSEAEHAHEAQNPIKIEIEN